MRTLIYSLCVLAVALVAGCMPQAALTLASYEASGRRIAMAWPLGVAIES